MDILNLDRSDILFLRPKCNFSNFSDNGPFEKRVYFIFTGYVVPNLLEGTIVRQVSLSSI